MKSPSDEKPYAIAGSKPQRHRPSEPSYLPPSVNMPDNNNNAKTTTTGSGSGTTASSSTGAKSSTGAASSAGAASSSGATGAAANTSTSSAANNPAANNPAANNPAANTAALCEMIENRDPDLLLCLSRGEQPRERTRRAPRWYDEYLGISSAVVTWANEAMPCRPC